MKTPFPKKTLIALVMVAAVGLSHVGLAQTDPIAPGTPLAAVVKLVQSGVDAGVIKAYVANSPSSFNLDAEKIIALTDLGVPAEVVNDMMTHDKNLAAAAPAPEPAATANPNDSTPTATPAADVPVSSFNDTLAPYGSWVDVEGYGRCWRPTTEIYDPSWRPYCDRGHWVYTDNGWYWDSDYAWGATFHYGRWFRHDRFGWCWWPDSVWAPSWVSWRSDNDYCGWAPLPPFAIFRPGIGFTYRGANVAVGFDFGLPVDCFTFVPAGRFCERQPRHFAVESRRVPEIFHRAAVINNFRDDNRIIVNAGIPVDRIRAATHQEIRPVAVGALPNAAHHGFHGEVSGPSAHPNATFGNMKANPGQGSGQPVQRDLEHHTLPQMSSPTIQHSTPLPTHPSTAPTAPNNPDQWQKRNQQPQSPSIATPRNPANLPAKSTTASQADQWQRRNEQPQAPIIVTPHESVTVPAKSTTTSPSHNAEGNPNSKTDKNPQNH